MTVYPAIYCRKSFDVINYATIRWMTFGFMRLATLQFELKLQKCIIMGKAIFKIFVWGGISSDIGSEIAVKLNFRPYIRLYIENLKYSYPLNNCMKSTYS